MNYFLNLICPNYNYVEGIRNLWLVDLTFESSFYYLTSLPKNSFLRSQGLCPTCIYWIRPFCRDKPESSLHTWSYMNISHYKSRQFSNNTRMLFVARPLVAIQLHIEDHLLQLGLLKWCNEQPSCLLADSLFLQLLSSFDESSSVPLAHWTSC